MSAPWHPGAIALCIRDDWETLDPGYRPVGDEPRKGQMLTVYNAGTLDGATWLMFEPNGAAFEAIAFMRFAAAPVERVAA